MALRFCPIQKRGPMQHDRARKEETVCYSRGRMPIDADQYRWPMEDLRCYKMELRFITMSLGCSLIPRIGVDRAHHRDSGTVALSQLFHYASPQ